MKENVVELPLESWPGRPRSKQHDAFVRMENVVEKFGDSAVVDNVSTSIAKNERFALFGGSGCEAALDLGARPLEVFCVITLPLISQALLSGWPLSFTASTDEVIPSAFLAVPGSTTLPLVVFSLVRMGLNPEMNALATLFITVLTLGVVAVNWAMLVDKRRKAAEAYVAFERLEADAAHMPIVALPAVHRATPGGIRANRIVS